VAKIVSELPLLFCKSVPTTRGIEERGIMRTICVNRSALAGEPTPYEAEEESMTDLERSRNGTGHSPNLVE